MLSRKRRRASGVVGSVTSPRKGSAGTMAAFPLTFVEREAHLERHLVAPDLPVLHLATHLGHLEPPDVADVADALVIAFWMASETLAPEVPTSSTSL